MTDLRVPLINLGLRLLPNILANLFTQVKPTGRSLPTSQKSCKPCSIHTDVGMAYLYIRDLVRHVDDDQPIPKGLGGTLDLARQHVDKASRVIPDLMVMDDRIYPLASDLGQDLISLEASLQHVENGHELRAILERCDRAVEKAYDIPALIYTQRGDSINSLRQEISELRKGLEYGHTDDTGQA